MDLEDIKEKVSSLPSWVWMAGAAIVAVIALLFLKGSGSASGSGGTTTGTGQTSDFTSALGGLSSSIDSLGQNGIGGSGGTTGTGTGASNLNPIAYSGPPGFFDITSNQAPVGTSPGDGYTWGYSGPLSYDPASGITGAFWSWSNTSPGAAQPLNISQTHDIGSTQPNSTPTPVADASQAPLSGSYYNTGTIYDTLEGTSKNSGINIGNLMSLNPTLPASDRLPIGTRINLPSGPTYTTGTAFDTLEGTSKNSGISLDALKQLNPGMSVSDRLPVGTKIYIPG